MSQCPRPPNSPTNSATEPEKFGYSARGLIQYTNQLGKGTLYDYDALSRKVAETNANSEIIRYTYNAAGDLKTLTDGKNQVTTWNYDLYGRVTNKLDQANVEILRYQYDADSRLTNRWSKAKGDTKYSYDPVGNLVLVDYPIGTSDITLQYDVLNRLTNMVDAARTTKYTYKPGGLLESEDGPWASDTVTNLYNNARLKSGLRLQQPTGTWTNGFTYDPARRLAAVSFSGGTFKSIREGVRVATIHFSFLRGRSAPFMTSRTARQPHRCQRRHGHANVRQQENGLTLVYIDHGVASRCGKRLRPRRRRCALPAHLQTLVRGKIVSLT